MKLKKEQGFTIIEVALVLAIAALIFLVVFLAVPALQRNQRDDARKRDLANIVQALTTFGANNSGQSVTGTTVYGGTSNSNLSTYVDSLSNNINYISVKGAPQSASGTGTGTTTTFATDQSTSSPATAAGTTTPNINNIVIFVSSQCGKSDGTDLNGSVSSASKRNYAVVVQIEAGGAGHYYCQNAS